MFDAIAMGVSAPYMVSDNSVPVNPARELFEALAEKHVPPEEFAPGGSSFQWTYSDAHLPEVRVMHLRISDDDAITFTQNTKKSTGGCIEQTTTTEIKWFAMFNVAGKFECRVDTSSWLCSLYDVGSSAIMEPVDRQLRSSSVVYTDFDAIVGME